MSAATVKVRLVFADHGAFHSEEVEVPVASLRAHERLIDCLREDPKVLARLHVDAARLCAAVVLDGA
ncbi:MAG: hypothetical protein FJ207_12950 [Gemmatimonadetes bacterium]|nr:hypothetical protein [Gemmatimonadota bacterium]